MSVTIKDVAREAGVAVSTVSRMLNNSGPVSPEARQRIEAAARRLGYVPNATARSLITSKTHTLGILLPDLFGEFYSEVLRGLDQTARQHAYHILVSSSHNERRDIEAALLAMNGRVDGLVVMAPAVDRRALRDNLPARLPVVLLNCHVDASGFDTIRLDNEGGARALVEHLIAHGHRHIAMITGGAGNIDAEERLGGYRAALEAAGLPVDPGLIVEGDFTQAAGYRAMQALLARTPRPTALFAANDAMAIGAMGALREAGLRVPEDVAVGGFDDIPMAPYLNPPLTSVHVPISELGALAMQRLIDRIENEHPPEPREEVIPTRLVVRASSGGPVVSG
ncbi:LacI family transcriptional regulator [Rhodocaloribacter litoris]|uniref:LacI family DNA-binding transcriptional regulator n=1 Tax=Rhodocaloribacter litoris TaxID=2558931 RepID=UPI0014220315|nr:LacI family DNA-binding transcriptional regulator [Rhodocaloribacter litoris]QXD15144.1 LacI family transcriptional regulator [Rhodocaloribacter litoris]